MAGAHFGDIYVYDIEARRRVLRVEGHSDDVNGVAFADSASSNVLISASDDSFVKVWCVSLPACLLAAALRFCAACSLDLACAGTDARCLAASRRAF